MDRGSNAGHSVSYETYRAEGDILFKQKEFKKAIESYTTALELKPDDKNCLCSRANCYIQVGDANSALEDSENILEQDPKHIKALFQKAESLYQQGEFEMAFVFYQRGHNQRPELQGFRLGIQKAKEAINNCVGDDGPSRLEIKGDLTDFDKMDEKKSPKKQARGGYTYKKPGKQDEKKKERPKRTEDTKTLKQLLGDLYADREYLEKLLNDSSMRKCDTTEKVQDLAREGLDYLDTRTDFWRQQKPMHGKKKKGQGKGNDKNSNPSKYVLRNLEEIEESQSQGEYEQSLKQAKKVLKTVQNWTEDDVPNKQEVIANLYSCIGNAYLEMASYDKSMDYHKKDKAIADKHDIEDAKSRSLDNIGRVYARRGDFKDAIEIWEEKLPMAKSDLEKTWLYHEMGRCHFQIGNYEEARDFGEKSKAAANESDDEVWQLNATVLVAQAEVKLGDLQNAVDSFETALDMAKVQGDSAAESAIKKALQDANDRIVRGVKDDDESQRSRSRSNSVKSDRSDKSDGSRRSKKSDKDKSSSRRNSNASDSGNSRYKESESKDDDPSKEDTQQAEEAKDDDKSIKDNDDNDRKSVKSDDDRRSVKNGDDDDKGSVKNED
ncbi:unnamed protein product [Owenia fusiformis]|uniref:Outer dynein arm-docking complex subunit 4 n=1 Tax=Owenia fusiformis TaxID=6347 RepID=A0A8S4P6V1_OWEFU|nr:unnamed protein product [Owenia fusiformis]